MEPSQESTTIDPPAANLDRYFIKKFSRWMDSDRRLIVVTGFYYGDGGKPNSSLMFREALDLLLVHEEKVDKIPIARFVNLVNIGKLVPWQDPEDRPLF